MLDVSQGEVSLSMISGSGCGEVFEQKLVLCLQIENYAAAAKICLEETSASGDRECSV